VRAGLLRVFHLDGSWWNQYGNDIVGEGDGGELGLHQTESPLFDLLGPLELLKMIHLTSSARRGAAPKLKELQASPQTDSQILMFEE